MNGSMSERYDVVIIGGGAAGLSGALALSRARRSVLVVDAGEQRNAPAGHVHNYLGREGTPPAELLAIGRREIESYGAEVVTGTVTHLTRGAGVFGVALADGRHVHARRLLVTTGLTDELPDIPGLAGRWGHDVLHCPYCHGWEVRDRAIGVIATGPMAVHAVQQWRQWSADVTLFLHTLGDLPDDTWEELAARGIAVVTGEVTGVEADADRLTGVRLADGTLVPRDAVVVQTRLRARADLLGPLGLETAERRVGDAVVGTYVPAEPTGATAVPGVYVAGNVADPFGQVIASAAAGLTAAGAINADLIAEETRAAVAARKGIAPHVAEMFTEAYWEDRYASRPALWSGRPNPHLVTDVEDLTPGEALDVGCGEGADAIWLAQRGWRVTGADISPTALDRAAAHAAAAGDDVAARTTWVRADALSWTPEPRRYDLVSAQFVHVPTGLREALFARLADAVAPGGTLLIGGHHPSDVGVVPRPDVPELFFTGEEIAALLKPDEWEVQAAEARPRTVAHPETGQQVTVHDAVLRARRR
ncbi:FAD-dependent oxidoreductase [Dactylosporangium fulvum]|uniref:FAD-dependent oxidoreductase n=1 Tax=Dactylosporangium fulvum TaxID=53359 RepID=A0ABY5WAI0_9ACTN|nr:FAD-dependent oxidoreductase [Dactylosporangium fulvum]UWP86024.1 FAD-dependent oxidoreductase [Dactylosporangium fulvum]